MHGLLALHTGIDWDAVFGVHGLLVLELTAARSLGSRSMNNVGALILANSATEKGVMETGISRLGNIDNEYR